MILLSRVASYGNTLALQKRGLKSVGKLSPEVINGRKHGWESPIFDMKNSTEERKRGHSEENYPVQPKSRKKIPLVGASVYPMTFGTRKYSPSVSGAFCKASS